MSNFFIPPYAKVLMEVRLGRINALDEYIKKNPSAINEKFQTSPNKKESLLELATRFEHYNVVVWLFNRGANDNPSSSPSLLTTATLTGNIDLVELFTKKGWDPWAVYDDTSPLKIAIFDSSLNILKRWKDLGVDLTITDEQGCNLLHYLSLSTKNYIDVEKCIELGYWFIDQGIRWDDINCDNLNPRDLCLKENIKEALDNKWQNRCAKISKENLNNSLSNISSSKNKNRHKKI